MIALVEAQKWEPAEQNSAATLSIQWPSGIDLNILSMMLEL